MILCPKMLDVSPTKIAIARTVPTYYQNYTEMHVEKVQEFFAPSGKINNRVIQT